MRKHYFTMGAVLLAIALLIAVPSDLLAQRTVDVPAGYGTLQAAIRADSLNRVADTTTVYLVHRGSADSIYVFTSTLTNWGNMPLNIRSVGTGALPTFVWVSGSGGSTYSPLISAKANLSIKGIYLNGVNTLGSVVDRMIRLQTNGITARFDSVFASFSGQSFVRVDAQNTRIFLRNCRVSNLFTDWANARGVDNRTVTIDTLVMVNCSFYRLGQRAYRDGGGVLTYGYFNHNTFTEIGGPVVSLGSAKTVVFVNNLSVNCGFLGQGISATGSLVGLSPIPSGQSVVATDNVFFADTAALTAAWKASSDTVKPLALFADTINTIIAAQGLTNTNIFSPVSFVMPPNNVVKAIKIDSIAKWYWKNPTVNATDATQLRVDSIKYVNLSYNTNAPAYTFGWDGKPAGATEWFGITVGVKRVSEGTAPEGFALMQNYPNPFNPTTRIAYTIAKASRVQVEIFNMLGQSVRTVMNGRQEPGSYTVDWDGRDGGGKIMPSGVYFYQLRTDGASLTKKMLLVK